MNTQRKFEIDQTASAAAATPAAGAPPINGPLGGQVGAWHEQLGRHWTPEVENDPLERLVSTLSRWAGPAIFLVTLGALVYWL